MVSKGYLLRLSLNDMHNRKTQGNQHANHECSNATKAPKMACQKEIYMSSVEQPVSFDAEDNGEVCIANISPAERRKRLNFGLIAFAISLIVLALLVVSGADRLWRLPLALLFMGAASGYFQWHDKTCVGLANISSRKIGDRMEKIEDASELAQVKRQARRVQVKALVAAVPLTLIALLLPVMG
jgi:hypothetical protein